MCLTGLFWLFVSFKVVLWYRRKLNDKEFYDAGSITNDGTVPPESSGAVRGMFDFLLDSKFTFDVFDDLPPTSDLPSLFRSMIVSCLH